MLLNVWFEVLGSISVLVPATFVWMYVMWHLAKVFRRGPAFALGLWVLPWLFLAILGFGSDEYAPAEAEKTAAPL